MKTPPENLIKSTLISHNIISPLPVRQKQKQLILYLLEKLTKHKIKSVQLLEGNLIVWETTKIVSKNVDSITHVLNWYDKQTTNIEDIMFNQREKLKTSHVCKNIIQIESLFHRLECLNFQKNCDSLNCLIEREKIYENKHLRNSRSLIVTKISKFFGNENYVTIRNSNIFQDFFLFSLFHDHFFAWNLPFKT